MSAESLANLNKALTDHLFDVYPETGSIYLTDWTVSAAGVDADGVPISFREDSYPEIPTWKIRGLLMEALDHLRSHDVRHICTCDPE